MDYNKICINCKTKNLNLIPINNEIKKIFLENLDEEENENNLNENQKKLLNYLKNIQTEEIIELCEKCLNDLFEIIYKYKTYMNNNNNNNNIFINFLKTKSNNNNNNIIINENNNNNKNNEFKINEKEINNNFNIGNKNLIPLLPLYKDNRLEYNISNDKQNIKIEKIKKIQKSFKKQFNSLFNLNSKICLNHSTIFYSINKLVNEFMDSVKNKKDFNNIISEENIMNISKIFTEIINNRFNSIEIYRKSHMIYKIIIGETQKKIENIIENNINKEILIHEINENNNKNIKNEKYIPELINKLMNNNKISNEIKNFYFNEIGNKRKRNENVIKYNDLIINNINKLSNNLIKK